MDYKFMPLSSSKAGFEHGKKRPGGAPCRKHMNPIELIFGRFFYAFNQKLLWCH